MLQDILHLFSIRFVTFLFPYRTGTIDHGKSLTSIHDKVNSSVGWLVYRENYRFFIFRSMEGENKTFEP